ncbi:MAG: type II and III secretion system protein [Anaerovibrio sp.]|nr:type II and III secretion system protein [Anaerovibrio sp.]
MLCRPLAWQGDLLGLSRIANEQQSLSKYLILFVKFIYKHSIGGDVPVPTVSTTNSTVTTSIEYRPAGIILRCCPMVNEAGQITSRIHTEVSSPQYVEEMKAYSFQRRSVDTTVRLQAGETLIIGGLISSEEIRSMSKLPFLGDLPILGQLFRSVHTSKTTSEVFIMLRAEILNK